MSKDRKWIRWWYEPWEYRQAEAWLEDLAAKGWQLESVGFIFGVFRKCEPARVKYRCVLCESPYQTDMQKFQDEMSAAGWRRIDNKSDFVVFIQEETGEDARNLVDQVSQIKYADKVLRRKFTMFIISLIAFACITVLLINNKSYMFINFVLDHELSLFLVFLCFVSYWIACGRALKALISKKWRHLIYTSIVPAKNLGKITRVINLITLLMLFLPGPGLVLGLIENKEKVLFEQPDRFAMITISDIAQDMETDGNSDPPLFVLKHSFLFPELLEHMDVAHTIYKDGVQHPIYIGFQSFRAISPWLARLLSESMAKDYVFFLGTSERPLPVSDDSMGFDKLWCADSPKRSTHEILALDGNMIYYISYESERSTDDIIELLKARIDDVKNKP